MLRFNEFEPYYGPLTDLDEGWAKLGWPTFKKYPKRRDHFLKKYKNKEEFVLVDSDTPVKLVYDQEIYDKIDNEDFTGIVLKGSNGKTYKIKELAKTAEFGGKGSGGGTVKEDKQLKSLQDQIIAAIKKSKKATISIDINGTKHDIAGAVSTPGVPKSDFHLIDIEGNEVVWISHKDGTTPKKFAQWGGVSKRKEKWINAHAETQSFISDVKEFFPDGLPRKTTIYREIKNDKIKKMSMYGNMYPGPLGRQNVSILLQGSVILKGNKLTADHVQYNDENVTDDYRPVFMAMYKGPDRNDFGIKKTRVVISPIGGRDHKLDGKTMKTEFKKSNFAKFKKALGIK